MEVTWRQYHSGSRYFELKTARHHKCRMTRSVRGN